MARVGRVTAMARMRAVTSVTGESVQVLQLKDIEQGKLLTVINRSRQCQRRRALDRQEAGSQQRGN